MREEWQSAKRIVVKIGSALLVNAETGELNREWLNSLVDDLAELKHQGKEIVLVSSGAIALGRQSLGLPAGPLQLQEGQASAAVGQIALAHAYEEIFKTRNIVTAQILLTLGDTELRRRYLNARSTIQTLLKLGAIPVVNENDTVATSEIRYGDNDRLAARVASMISADCLILLSDIDGLYTAPPNNDPNAKLIEEVSQITPEIEAMAGDAGTALSRGGMVTKIVAAKIAVSAGTHMVITTGRVTNPLKTWQNGGNATWFLSNANPVTARKKWIAGSLVPKGKLVIDNGAAKALSNGNSLLPAGVVAAEGEFDRGDAVTICDQQGSELGRGLVAYNNKEAQIILGQKSDQIIRRLGYEGRSELVHRDDMVLNEFIYSDI
ncbi:MAG: glutamate 5-kinase [Methyloligellaceae bacterium]